MRSEANPFTSPGQVRGVLYASADRIARRTGVLHHARVTGGHAGEVICDLAVAAPERTPGPPTPGNCAMLGRVSPSAWLAPR